MAEQENLPESASPYWDALSDLARALYTRAHAFNGSRNPATANEMRVIALLLAATWMATAQNRTTPWSRLPAPSPPPRMLREVFLRWAGDLWDCWAALEPGFEDDSIIIDD